MENNIDEELDELTVEDIVKGLKRGDWFECGEDLAISAIKEFTKNNDKIVKVHYNIEKHLFLLMV